MGKKRFGLNETINKGFSDVVNRVENYKESFDSQATPLNSIKPDPTNPRYLLITPERIRKALKDLSFNKEVTTQADIEAVYNKINETVKGKGADAEKYKSETEAIKDLATSILNNNLIHPILLFKDIGNYQIIAGERRYLAHVFLNRTYIDTRVFKEKPNEVVKKVAQWVENVQREDLSLFSRIENVKHIAEEYSVENGKKLTPTILLNLTGISKTSASNYLSVANAGKDVLSALEAGSLPNLKIATFIATTSDSKTRSLLIEEARNGARLEGLKQFVSKAKQKNQKTRGRKAGQITLGKTKNIPSVKKMITAVIKEHDLENVKKGFNTIDWGNFAQITKLFKETLMELSSDDAN